MASESLQLKSSKKYNNKDSLIDRIKSADETLTEIMPISKKIGVTRISDITRLDKLYIPNFSAILPGTEDSIWVYSGKGATQVLAKAGAVMEAVERYSSISKIHSRRFIKGTYSQLSECYDKVLHPAEVVEPVNHTYYENSSIVDFLPGFDILNKDDVLVPAQLALAKYSASSLTTSPFLFSHTNGIASGNVLEEAICHALCEVIERDAISIADLCASCIPYTILEKINNTLNDNWTSKRLSKSIFEERFVDDSSIFPDVDISEIVAECEPIRFLVKRFTGSGIPLLIKDITQRDIGIPTFVASCIEWLSESYGYLSKGFGTSPDARVALIRAITEVSQTRAVNIQGARDDLRKIKYKQDDNIHNRKWQFIPSSSLLKKNDDNRIKFSGINTYKNEDILNDIQLILNRLKLSGLKRVIVVDLTDPMVGIPVVRTIVPGLETSEVTKSFTGKELLMGTRAKNHFVKMFNLQARH